jgi:hypothetical protein
MADENYLRDLDDDVDPAELAAVQQLLAGLAFLRPDQTPAATGSEPEPMPDWAWERIRTALAAETARAAAPVPGRSRLARWGGGLVAASVAVLAVGVAVTAFQGSGSGDAVVAGGEQAPVASAAALLAEAPVDDTAAGAAAAPNADAPSADAKEGAGAELFSTPERLSFAGMVPPAQMVVDSDTDYTSGGLRGQVRSVLSQFGMADQQEAEKVMTASAPVEVEDVPDSGFTATAESLRDCIDRLTADADATALLVDRATYEGQDAGVVVAPEDAAATSAPDVSELQVWVVDEDCDILVRAFTIRLVP